MNHFPDYSLKRRLCLAGLCLAAVAAASISSGCSSIPTRSTRPSTITCISARRPPRAAVRSQVEDADAIEAPARGAAGG